MSCDRCCEQLGANGIRVVVTRGISFEEKDAPVAKDAHVT
jgi:hypothetical protein